MQILIISASVRLDRQSHKVALFFQQYIKQQKLAEVDMADLASYDFPIFEERLENQENPLESAKKLSAQIVAADAIIIVTPEYNSGYPASLKNALDLITWEWKHKVIGLATASSGMFGGIHAQLLLLPVFLKLRTIISPVVFPNPQVQINYDDAGNPKDPESVHKRADAFLGELLWLAGALKK